MPPSTYQKPVPIPELMVFSVQDADTATAVVKTSVGMATWVNDDIQAIRDTKRYQTVEMKAEVGPVLKQGDKAHGLFLIERSDGSRFYTTAWYTIFNAADFKRIKD